MHWRWFFNFIIFASLQLSSAFSKRKGIVETATKVHGARLTGGSGRIILVAKIRPSRLGGIINLPPSQSPYNNSRKQPVPLDSPCYLQPNVADIVCQK
jgi:hypothetical protein